MCITIGHLTFDHVQYDPTGDVLYLHVGEPTSGGDNDETPEGHIVRFGADGSVVGVTILNAKWLIDRGSPIAITLPARVEVDPDSIASAVYAA